MFGNYLTTALRSIARHKLYSFINIAGLAVGLACVILVVLFIRDELSFDAWVPDSANLYRVEETFMLPGRPPLRTALADFPLAQMMKDNLPQITAITRVWPRSKTVTVAGRSFSQQIAEVDSGFFQVIRFPLVAGDPALALSRPDDVVISQSLARKLFGTEKAMGRMLTVNKANCPKLQLAFESASCDNQAVSLRITGIMRDLPHNTHLPLDVVMPHTSPADSITEAGKRSYFSVNGASYIRLVPGTDPAQVLARLPALLDRHVNVLEDLGMQLQASKTIGVDLTPFARVHLATTLKLGEMVPPTSIPLLFANGLIGALILLVACFNFTNLATALAMTRAREIALRKCAGAKRSQIIIQFLGESVLTALLALVLALSLVEILLPGYGNFIGRPFVFHYASDWRPLLLIMGIAVAAGLVAGAYPALVLSRFMPAPVLRANDPGHTGSSRLRAALVVLQFAVAIGLGVAALVVFAQVDFMRHQSLGFRRDNILTINTNRRMTDEARESFVAELGKHPGILGVARSSDAPFSPGTIVAQMKLPGHPEYITMERKPVTPEYFRLYDIPLVAGRFFSDARGNDRMKAQFPQGLFDGLNIMINRTAAARFGFTAQSAVGQTVVFGTSKVTIAGVVADTRLDGARAPTRALVYTDDPIGSSTLSLRVAPGQAAQVTDFVDRTWRRFSPNVAI
ncbi:MAG TPA: ABC transporter permease, partial [Rhizomicrobium sp.]|nr:ABC transporter permease [Rhizomicrobium sp.]